MSDPLLESLPLLDLARKAVPVLDYLRVRRWYGLLEKRREAAESLRRALALSEQMCALHGSPEASSAGMSIALGSPLWCGCNWRVDFTREGTRALFFHRRDPGTGVTLGAVFPAYSLPLREDQIRELREAFSDSVSEEQEPCDRCHGSRTIWDGKHVVRCPDCGGTGVK